MVYFLMIVQRYCLKNRISFIILKKCKDNKFIKNILLKIIHLNWKRKSHYLFILKDIFQIKIKILILQLQDYKVIQNWTVQEKEHKKHHHQIKTRILIVIDWFMSVDGLDQNML
jgi:hypothetical protein